ncbi:MAG: CDP-alcohol phosphatidyltransferase family protein [Acidimicrobiales bacterium]
MKAVPTEALDGEAGDLDRIWTVPNLISCTRIVLLGVFCWLLFGPGERIAATIVLMVAGGTDFLDGFLARKLHQVSTLGKIIDPFIDRIVLMTAIVAIVIYGAVPIWLAAVVLGREVIVSGAVLVLAAMGAKRIDVVWMGKAGTCGLMCCFPLFLLGDEHATWARVLTDATWVAVVPALLLSLAAGIAYVPRARGVLGARQEERARKGTVTP